MQILVSIQIPIQIFDSGDAEQKLGRNAYRGCWTIEPNAFSVGNETQNGKTAECLREYRHGATIGTVPCVVYAATSAAAAAAAAELSVAATTHAYRHA